MTMRVLLLLFTGVMVSCGSQTSPRPTTHTATVYKNDADQQSSQANKNPSNSDYRDSEDAESDIDIEEILARRLNDDNKEDDKEVKEKYDDAKHFCQYYPATGNQQVDTLQASALTLEQSRKVLLLLQQAEEAGASQDLETRNSLLGEVQDEVEIALQNYASRCGTGDMQLAGGILESIFGAVSHFLGSALGIVTTFASGVVDLAAYTLKSSILAINQTANIALFGAEAPTEEEGEEGGATLQRLREPFPG